MAQTYQKPSITTELAHQMVAAARAPLVEADTPQHPPTATVRTRRAGPGAAPRPATATPLAMSRAATPAAAWTRLVLHRPAAALRHRRHLTRGRA
jgi:hypothetical protein